MKTAASVLVTPGRPNHNHSLRLEFMVMAKKKNSAPASNEQIPAVSYWRQSTDGIGGDGQERQESSESRQAETIARLEKEGGYKIVGAFGDKGVSGWKRGAKRPGFAKMVDAVSRLGARAILCEDLDRFSRATVGEVQADAQKLIDCGIRWIVTDRDTYDLGDKHNIGEIIKFVAAVWAASEFSRKLAYRIAVTRANAAKKGLRSGSPAPFGYKNEWLTGADGKRKFTGRIIPGDPEQIATVHRIFSMIVDDGGNPLSIAKKLNAEGVRCRRTKWTGGIVKHILTSRDYIGEFRYGDKPEGNFYRLNSKGEVVAVDDLEPGEVGMVFIFPNAHEPLIDPKTFDRAAKIINGRKSAKRSVREHAHLLSARVYCDHCGSKMSGALITGRVRYRCGSYIVGKGCCANLWHEDVLVSWIVRTLADELRRVAAPAVEIPVAIDDPGCARYYETERLESEIEELDEKIKRGRRRLVDVDDDDVLEVNALLREMKAEVAAKQAELYALRDAGASAGADLTPDEQSRLAAYLEEMRASFIDTDGGQIDAKAFRHLLETLNVKIVLAFKEVPYGKGIRKRYEISAGSMTWGTNKAEFSGADLVSERKLSTHR